MGTYLIMQPDRFSGRSTPDVVRAAADGGIDVVQFREKHASVRDRYEVGRESRAVTADVGVPPIVNDRVDITAAIDADGTHLGDDDVPVSVAREQLGEDAVVGRSVSTVAGARAAEKASADYLSVGAVLTTDTRETNLEQSEVRTERVSTIVEAVSIPFIGIGDVTPDNTADVVAAGADGVAVMSAITAVDDSVDTTRHLADSVATGKNRR